MYFAMIQTQDVMSYKVSYDYEWLAIKYMYPILLGFGIS